MAESFDIPCEQGASLDVDIIWEEDSGDGRGFQRKDLTGYTAKMQVRDAQAGDTGLVVEFSTENGKLVIDPNGVILLRADADTTSAISRSGVYDLFVTAPRNIIANVTPISATANTFTVSGAPFHQNPATSAMPWAPLELYDTRAKVISGLGAHTAAPTGVPVAQRPLRPGTPTPERLIINNTGTQVVLGNPWQIIPDATSVISIYTPSKPERLLVGNFTLTPRITQ